MANARISELPAASAAASANEVEINEAGTSKKITIAQLRDLLANPSSDDGDALGTSALRWSDLFLASGGVINFENTLALELDGTGVIIGLTSTSVAVTVPIEIGPGTTAVPPIQVTPGTLMTSPAAGGIELDATNFYGTTDAGNRGYIPVRHFMRQAVDRSLTSSTAEQSIFDAANDFITLEAGVYRFEMLLRVTGLSGTSGNARIELLGAGTAVVDTWAWWYNAVDNSSPSPGPVTAQSGWPFQVDSAASIATAGTGTGLGVVAFGTFDVTTGGTFNPIIDLVTAAAGVVTAGSYFMCERMGASNVVALGQVG